MYMYLNTYVNTYIHTELQITFFEQGAADTSLEAKGVFLQIQRVFSRLSFYTRAFFRSCKFSPR